MASQTPADSKVLCEIALPDETATVALARSLAMFMCAGDLVLLKGDLGAGKTTLARAIVRAVAADDELEVPSPTFTLVQAYELPGLSISHMDFYRLEDPAELDELGLDDALQSGAVLAEWPQRADGVLPSDALTISLSELNDGRLARLSSPSAGWAQRIARLQSVDGFLEAAGWAGAHRARIAGDASSRRYERLSGGPDGRAALLMDMPSRPDGPPVRDGKPYSQIAHLAEDIRAVEAVYGGLREAELSAPEIYAIDLTSGLALTQDFGPTSFNALITSGQDISEPLLQAVELLADMTTRPWPGEVCLSNGDNYTVPPYDIEALLIEAELCLDWYCPHLGKTGLTQEDRDVFVEAWKQVLPLAETQTPVWVLRDFHVDNLFWLPELEGAARVGLIDTQDCVMGHPAYDLASLLLDVRVTINPSDAEDYLSAYCALRAMHDARFDEAGFRTAYAVLGAQRATKILGIFARLAKRDGKPHYLKHLPRTNQVLDLCLVHPALAPVKTWFDTHLPRNVRHGETA